MKPTVAQAVQSGQPNAFHFLRFAAATLVLWSHSYPLTGHHSDPWVGLFAADGGFWAVSAFFILSGYMIASSWERHPQIGAFFQARAARIYPALWLNLVFCLGLYFALGQGTLNQVLQATSLSFFVHNAFLWAGVRFELPGLFENLPHLGVNGSLWTLPWELYMYALLALLGACGLLKKSLLVLGLVGLSTLIYGYCDWSQRPLDKIHLLSQFASFFGTGVLFWTLRTKIQLNSLWAICALLLALFSSHWDGLRMLIPLLLGYFLLWAGYTWTGPFRHWNQLGDHSYGLYLYAFPIQQSLVHFCPGIQPWTLTLYAFPLAWLCAALSWRWIEKPALKYWKPHNKVS